MLKSFIIKIKSQNQSENSLEQNASNSVQNASNSVQNASNSVQNASNSVQNASNSEQNDSNPVQNSKISKQSIMYLFQTKQMSWKEWIYTVKNLIYSISLQDSLLNHSLQPINLLLNNFLQPEVLEFIKQKIRKLYAKSVNYIKLAESLYSDMYDIINNKKKYEDLIHDHFKVKYSKIHLFSDEFLQLINRKYGVEVLIKKMKAYYSKEFSDKFINEIKEKYKNDGWYEQIPKNINSVSTLNHRISNGLHFCFMEEIKMINKFLNRVNILNIILITNKKFPLIINFTEIKDNMEKMEKMEKMLKFDKYFESELYKKEINNIIQYCILQSSFY